MRRSREHDIQYLPTDKADTKQHCFDLSCRREGDLNLRRSPFCPEKLWAELLFDAGGWVMALVQKGPLSHSFGSHRAKKSWEPILIDVERETYKKTRHSWPLCQKALKSTASFCVVATSWASDWERRMHLRLMFAHSWCSCGLRMTPLKSWAYKSGPLFLLAPGPTWLRISTGSHTKKSGWWT